MTSRLKRPHFALVALAILAGCTQLKVQPSTTLSPSPGPSPSASEDDSPSPDESPSASPSTSPTPSPSPTEDLTAPKVAFLSPTAGADFTKTAVDIAITVTVGNGRKVVEAKLLYDNRVLATFTQNAAQYRADKWNPQQLNSVTGDAGAAPFGDHVLTATVKDDKGTESKAELKFYKPIQLGAWEEATAMSAPRAYAQAFSDGAVPVGYLLPWGDTDDSLDPAVEATGALGFTPSGDGSWTATTLSGTSVPRAAYGATTFPGDVTRIYLVGGRRGGTDLRTVELLSPLTRQAEQSLASLTNARMKPAVTILDGYLYVIGGQRGSAGLTSVERVKLADDGTPSGTFEALADLPSARVGGHAIAVGKEIWVIGGGFKPILVYTPATNTWANMTTSGGTVIGTPETWHDAAMIPAGTRYYFFGGQKEDGSAYDRISEFDPVGKAWRDLGPLPVVTGVTDVQRPETGMMGAYDGGAFYLMGGVSLPDNTITDKVFKVPAL